MADTPGGNTHDAVRTDGNRSVESPPNPYDNRARIADLSILLSGVALVVLTAVVWQSTDLVPFNAVVVALPGAATTAVWLLARRGTVPATLYSRVFGWLLAGGALLGGLILAVLLLQGGPLVDGLPLLLFMVGIGTTAGTLSGANRAQSLWAQRQAEALRHERERLDFLNNLLRHNVLNKVNVIQGNATFAAEEAEGELAAYFETIQDQSDDVVEVIENVRVLVNATTSETALQAVDCSRALRKEVASLEQSDEVTVTADIPDGVTVVGDELLRYVFENLLTNAVQHNDADDPHVAVTVEREGDTVVVTIADNGSGIPDDERGTLFEPVMQGDHGVGLYLVETLVTSYGGSVAAGDSDELGGAELVVRLQTD